MPSAAFLPSPFLPLSSSSLRLRRQPYPLTTRLRTFRHPLKSTLQTPPTSSPLSLPPSLSPPSTQCSLPSHPPTPPLWDYAWPRLLLLLVAAVWGTNFATVKLLQSGLHAVPIPVAAASRFSLAALVIAPFAIYEQRNIRTSLSVYTAGIGIGICIAAGYITQSISLVSTTASKSAFICSLAVVAVPVLERILYKLNLFPPPEKETPLVTWGAPALALVGVAFLELSGISGPTIGDAYALLQAVFFAAGFITNSKAAANFPGLMVTLSAIQLATVGLISFLWAFFVACSHAGALALPDFTPAFSTPENLVAIVYAGVVTTALAVWWENIALQHVSAAELAVLLSTEPFFAAAFSGLLLGEEFGVQGIAGGAMILAACLLNQAKNINSENLMQKGSVFATGLGSLVTILQIFLGDGGDSPLSRHRCSPQYHYLSSRSPLDAGKHPYC